MLYEAHGISRFIVVCGYTDLRKSISGLAQIIEGNYLWIRSKQTPCSCFVVNVVIGSQGSSLGRKWVPAPLQEMGTWNALLAKNPI